MAVYTTPASSDVQAGPLDTRIYFYNGQVAHTGHSLTTGDSAMIKGTGVLGQTDAMQTRLDANGQPIDEHTLFYDGQKTHYFFQGHGETSNANTGSPVNMSRL